MVRAMKRGLKLQNMMVKKRIPKRSVSPFSVSGSCSHDNQSVLISGLSCSCTDLEPTEGGDNGECHGQEYVGGREDCETGLSECADGEHADLPPPRRRPLPLSHSAGTAKSMFTSLLS